MLEAPEKCFPPNMTRAQLSQGINRKIDRYKQKHIDV